jgi:integrase/ribosomal protein L40E
MGYKELATINRKDIESYIIERRKTKSPYTLDGDILELRLFFDWFKPGLKLFEGIKFKAPKNNLPVDQPVLPEDVRKLLAECTTQRDRALVTLLWDSACRLDEVMHLQIGHVQFDQYGAVIIVKGKTGERRLRLVDSVPDLQAWVNIHPLKDKADAPLFVTTRRYQGKLEPLHRNTVQNTLKRLAKNADIKKWISPHALRHGRLTDLVKQGFNESELRIIAGWEKDSGMAAIYVHLGGGDVEHKILVKNKLIKDSEEATHLNSTTPKDCPRCKTRNPADAKYCSSCSFILDLHVAKEVEEHRKVIPEALALVQNNPEFQRMLSEMLAKTMQK